MAISEEKRQRCAQALSALKAVRDEYSDVLAILDYVTLLDIATYGSDDDAIRADDVLSDEELEGVLWRIGKYANSAQTSQDLLPTWVQYALDDHERKKEVS